MSLLLLFRRRSLESKHGAGVRTGPSSAAALLNWMSSVVEEHQLTRKVEITKIRSRKQKIIRHDINLDVTPRDLFNDKKPFDKVSFLEQFRQKLKQIPSTTPVDAFKTPRDILNKQIAAWRVLEPLLIENISTEDLKPLLNEWAKHQKEIEEERQLDDDLIMICLLE